MLKSTAQMFLFARRPGRIQGAGLAFLVSIAVLIALVALLIWDPSRWHSTTLHEPLLVLCAASLKPPVEAAALEYEQSFGVPVHLQYGGSQTLLAGIEVTQRGDLFLPADDDYLRTAHEKGLLSETIPLAKMTPVLAVRKGNPKGLHALDDLFRDGVRLSQANPDAAAIGRLTRQVLRESGDWQRLEKRITVSKPTVTDVANDIAIGAVDAGFVWDVNVKQSADLEVVSLSQFNGVSSNVTVGVLRCSGQPTEAVRFARYLASRDGGQLYFKELGYASVDSEPWAGAK